MITALALLGLVLIAGFIGSAVQSWSGYPEHGANAFLASLAGLLTAFFVLH